MEQYSPTLEDIHKLREMTGAGMMDCKKALCYYSGDFTMAILWLKHKQTGPHIDVWGRKVFADDFYNMKRINDKGFYRFDIKGESSKHLKEKYKLDYDNVFIAIYSDGSYGSVGSYQLHGVKSDVSDLDEYELKDIYRQIRLRLLIAEDLQNEK